MADEDRTFLPTEAQANRARQQGLGVGQKEMDAQRDPSREQHATVPDRTEAFDDAETLAAAQDGQTDNPEEDWGEPAGEDALHGANHTRRPAKTEAERGQGAKTRQHTKDIISRRV
jgi:hypothetical protein